MFVNHVRRHLWAPPAINPLGHGARHIAELQAAQGALKERLEGISDLVDSHQERVDDLEDQVQDFKGEIFDHEKQAIDREEEIERQQAEIERQHQPPVTHTTTEQHCRRYKTPIKPLELSDTTC